MLFEQAYISQIVVMAMLALAIGGDAISNQAIREAIIDCLFDFQVCFTSYLTFTISELLVNVPFLSKLC